MNRHIKLLCVFLFVCIVSNAVAAMLEEPYDSLSLLINKHKTLSEDPDVNNSIQDMVKSKGNFFELTLNFFLKI